MTTCGPLINNSVNITNKRLTIEEKTNNAMALCQVGIPFKAVFLVILFSTSMISILYIKHHSHFIGRR